MPEGSGRLELWWCHAQLLLPQGSYIMVDGMTPLADGSVRLAVRGTESVVNTSFALCCRDASLGAPGGRSFMDMLIV